MPTIVGRMRNCINFYKSQDFGNKKINYESDAQNIYNYVFKNNSEEYVDADMFSVLLYKTWGELLMKKGIIKAYNILVKNYRYVLEAVYEDEQCSKPIILGSDGLVSVKKCNDDINEHRYIGGFALWPSHKGGINFRKNRYGDNIFKTLEDIEGFYNDRDNYQGVIPEEDYEWFEYLGKKDGFAETFFFED